MSAIRRLGEPIAGNLKTEIKTSNAAGNSELVWECISSVLTEYKAEPMDDETVGGGLSSRPFNPRRNLPANDGGGGGGGKNEDDKDKPKTPCPECGEMHWLQPTRAC